ncbi:hypothetical protein AaE_008183 [Aphanomyces astaci]|uniref:Uncharacterized protein n=1 Tax=Aphanomyces astaci TaxID=112090 RepID=A0A6A4ZVI1_APHAT|nr:hypothetical protein AaE_008183 [Aphanomyces astaci]
MAAAAAGFVEFHRSMSLEHQAIPPPLPAKGHRKRVDASVSYHASPHVTVELSTVDQVLECRNELWEHVDEILESVTGEMSSAMAAAVDKTKQLKKLHAICHAREQHVHTIKLGLMHERNEYLAKLIAIQA